MKYRIRINGEIKEIEGELGSGIFDKNGREIFEGDKIVGPGIYPPAVVQVIFHVRGGHLEQLKPSAYKIVKNMY